MRTPLILALALGSVSLSACATTDYGDRYGYNRSGDRYSDYRPRGDRHYRSRVLSSNDTIYRDENGNYYCKRSDGTKGAIVGAIAGGILGNIIAPGGSKTLGTILGAGGGAIAGGAIASGDNRCE
ncbi:MAG: hypothetical protein J7494_00550 [Sphingobium sp.]|nr:hypothetical protein [Sphingobium sp.]